jgi:phenylpropionate dioxygenase-like ring-hydroxylating dioxygenase large terminal subunit
MAAPSQHSPGAATEPAPGRYDPYFRPGYVHRALYTSPDIFDQEMRHLFANTWVYVGHESEVPAPNDFVTRSIGRRPIILSRGKTGSLHVLFNRCTHRGALVCRQAQGNAPRFVCGYHAWTFGIDGSCVGVPLSHAYGQDFDRSAQSLRRAARVESYRGFVFACLNAPPDGEVIPLIDHLAHARRYLDEWLDRGDCLPVVVRAGSMRFETHANWKVIYDNAGDGYHPPFSHISMLRVFARRYGDVDMQYYSGNFDEAPLLSRDLGNGHTLLDQRPSMHAQSAWERQHVMPGRETLWQQLNRQHGEERALAMLDASTGSGLNLNIFPNLLIIGNQIQVLEPISVNRTVVHWFSTTLEGAPDEVNALRMRMQEDFPSFGEVDDTAQFEACQAGMENVPEMPWIDIRRHMETGVGAPGDDGIWTEPISSDQHMRCYFEAWRRAMNAGAAREGADA